MSNRPPVVNLGVVEHTPVGGQGAKRPPVVVDDGKWAFAVPVGEEDVVDAEVVGSMPPANRAKASAFSDDGKDMSEQGEFNEGGLLERKFEKPDLKQARNFGGESQGDIPEVVDPSMARNRHLGAHARGIFEGAGKAGVGLPAGFVAKTLDDTDRSMGGNKRNPAVIGTKEAIRSGGGRHEEESEDLESKLKEWINRREGLDWEKHLSDEVFATLGDPDSEAFSRRAFLLDQKFLSAVGFSPLETDKPEDLERRYQEALFRTIGEVGKDGGFRGDVKAFNKWMASGGFIGTPGEVEGQAKYNPYAHLPPPPVVAEDEPGEGKKNRSIFEATIGREPVIWRKLKDRFPFLDDKEEDVSVRLRSLRNSLGALACAGSVGAGAVYTLPKFGFPGVVLGGAGAVAGKITRRKMAKERSRAKLNAEPVLTKPDSWRGRRKAERQVKDDAYRLALVGSKEERRRRLKKAAEHRGDEVDGLRGASVLTAPVGRDSGRRVSPAKARAVFDALPKEERDRLIAKGSTESGRGRTRK